MDGSLTKMFNPGRIWQKKIPAYIHIPKTGGTYLGQKETDEVSVLQPMVYLGHGCVIKSRYGGSNIYPPKVGFLPNYILPYEKVKKYFLFSSVRNIFSFLVSYYHHAGGFNPKYCDPDHYDYANARKGFDYLVQTIADRDGSIWPNNKLIHFQIFADDAALIADWICRNDVLDEDLDLLSQFLGIRYKQKPRQREGHKHDYRTYYTDKLISVVWQTWEREMKLFGFGFERNSDSEAILRGRVRKNAKNRIRYSLEKDELVIVPKKSEPTEDE